MKTVAVFSAYYYPHLGGIERYIDNMMREFIKRNIRVILITSNYNNDVNYEFKNDLYIYRLPVYNIFKNRYPIIKKNKEYYSLIKELGKEKIDCIIVNTRFHLTSHVGINFAKKRNIPVYLIEHGSNYVTVDNKFLDFFANRYEDFLTYKIKKNVTGFYGVSNACSDWLKQFKIKASGTWYNSIDFDQKKGNKKKHNSVNFLYAGRLIKQKGVENILKSFINLEKKYDNIKLYIAGDGPEFNYYKENYVSSNITFLGKLEYKELLKYYLITDIFLYPPLWPEGLPTSILEAGLTNCAVIATDQGGISEVINEETGLLVGNTQKELEKGMEELIKNKKLRDKYTKNLNESIKNNFSWSVTSEKILKDVNLWQK